jgi:arylsulfatase A
MRSLVCGARSGVLAGLALVAIAGAAERSSGAPAALQRPNVVLFLSDDLGYGDLACHGNPHVKTPQLDQFASQAVEFSRFYVNPVCAPTRAALMTGRYNFRTGVADVFGKGCELAPAEVTVATILRKAGYATGLFGKWHLGNTPATAPEAHGFDEVLTFHGHELPAGEYFNPTLLHNGKPEKQVGYCEDIFTDAAIAFVRQHRGKPFFVYLPTNLIHVPLVVDAKRTAQYEGLGLHENTRKLYGMVSSTDYNFGRLRAAVKEQGLEENTLFIYLSDNGPSLTLDPATRYVAGLNGLKGTVYDGGIRVPCFVRWPAGFKSPATVKRMATLMDLLPTILDVTAAPLPADVKLDGRSLLPLLRNPAADWPDGRTFFTQWDSGQTPRRGQAFAVITEKWKLVQAVGMDMKEQQHIRDTYARLCELQGRGRRSIDGILPRFELYDIANDPTETRDVAAEHPEVVEQLRNQYNAWFGDVWKP